MKRLNRIAAALILGVIALTFSGCPDRSHQRPVPNYDAMSDGGGDEQSEDNPGDTEQ